VRWVNEKDIQTYKGKQMGIDSVKRLLKNRRYTGEYIYSKTVIPNGILAIVPIIIKRVVKPLNYPI
jgi:hypothetical protein